MIERAIPGLTSGGVAAFESACARLRLMALGGARADRHALLVEGDDCTVFSRSELAAHLRGHGLSAIARKVERTPVPPRSCLVLAVLEETRLLVLEIEPNAFGPVWGPLKGIE